MASPRDKSTCSMLQSLLTNPVAKKISGVLSVPGMVYYTGYKFVYEGMIKPVLFGPEREFSNGGLSLCREYLHKPSDVCNPLRSNITDCVLAVSSIAALLNYRGFFDKKPLDTNLEKAESKPESYERSTCTW